MNTDITSQEMQRLSEALRNEEFKSLFLDYVNEISDPKNRKLYEEELKALEAEQGRDLTFVNPEPHFTVKTMDSLGKEAVAKKSGKGSHWSIPYSLGSPREDVDAGNKECKVYDVVFHPKTLDKCTSDARYKDLIISTAIEGIEKQFSTMLDKKYKLPKLKVKGVIPSTVIRDKKKEENSTKVETSSEFLTKILESQRNSQSEDVKPVLEEIKTTNNVPEYTIVHQGIISDYTDFTNSREKTGTRPDVLVLKVKLPKINSISQIELDTFEKCVELNVPGIYQVLIPLPFSVAHDEGTAKFDKVTKELSVSLPVVKPAFLKPEKILIEEVEEDEQDPVDLVAENQCQETEKSSVSTDKNCDQVMNVSAPTTEKNDDKSNHKKVPIFHMRQDISSVSFMIPQQVTNTEIQFTGNSVLFEFSNGTEGYRLQIKFQDNILTENSKIDIEELYTLISLKKESDKEWDFVTVYSQGMEYNRRFYKTMSEAENELWNNPSELLKTLDEFSPNAVQDDVTSIDDSEVSQVPAATDIDNSPVSGQYFTTSQRDISDVNDLRNLTINEGITDSQSSSVIEGNHLAVSDVIKNSYLFELDD